MKTIEQTYHIEAPVAQVWAALTEPSIIDDWGGGPAEMSAEQGEVFSLWGGDIHGTNTKVVADELLEQDWYSGDDWPAPSKVSFRLQAKGSATELVLTHTNVPEADADDIAEGWATYYLGPLKELLEK